MRFRSLCFATLAALGCSHTQLSGADLDRLQRPAYVARVAEGAGPKTEGVPGAQTQLVTAMNAAIGRFEVSERLRSQVSAALKTEKPWSNAVPASQVASALESFLVERVPAVAPDYNRLKPTGADSVLELVVEEYGLRPEAGKSQTFLGGYARLFLLADGTELWRVEFQRSGSAQGLPALEAPALQPNASVYGDQLRVLLDGSAAALAQELTPPGRGAGPPAPSGAPLLPAPETEQQGKTRAPAPDLTAPAELPTPTDRTKPKQPPPDLTTPSEQPVTPKTP